MSLLLLLLLLLHSISFTAADPLIYKCEGTNKTADSSYTSDLSSLLNYFMSLNSTNFTTYTSGKANGLFLCRGDVSSTDCTNCVVGASSDILSLCPNYTRATVWYDFCQLRYSDTRFFGTAESNNGIILYNVYNSTDRSNFVTLERSLLGSVTEQAAYISSDMFATGTAVNGSLMGNASAQCTRDISKDQCNQCLKDIERAFMDYDLEKQQGGRALAESCNFRYEIYAFFRGEPTIFLNMSPSQPSSSLPPPSPTHLTPLHGQGIYKISIRYSKIDCNNYDVACRGPHYFNQVFMQTKYMKSSN